MRAYLSSYRLGNHPEKFVEMVGKGARVAVIMNACDAALPVKRSELAQRELHDIRSLGLQPEEVDLRDYFISGMNIYSLDEFDGIWVRGGNVFNLRRAMKTSKFDNVLAEVLAKDTKVYGGYSAGICVLSPDLHGIELCDPVDNIPVGYSKDVIWEGLSVVPYSIAPHYRSDHPESPLIERLVEYFKENKIMFRALHDGEAIVINGDREFKV